MLTKLMENKNYDEKNKNKLKMWCKTGFCRKVSQFLAGNSKEAMDTFCKNPYCKNETCPNRCFVRDNMVKTLQKTCTLCSRQYIAEGCKSVSFCNKTPAVSYGSIYELTEDYKLDKGECPAVKLICRHEKCPSPDKCPIREKPKKVQVATNTIEIFGHKSNKEQMSQTQEGQITTNKPIFIDQTTSPHNVLRETEIRQVDSESQLRGTGKRLEESVELIEFPSIRKLSVDPSTMSLNSFSTFDEVDNRTKATNTDDEQSGQVDSNTQLGRTGKRLEESVELIEMPSIRKLSVDPSAMSLDNRTKATNTDDEKSGDTTEISDLF